MIRAMRWRDGRLQLQKINNQWVDFSSVPLALSKEREGQDQIFALEYGLFRVCSEDEGEEFLTLPHHSKGWFAYQYYHNRGVKLVK